MMKFNAAPGIKLEEGEELQFIMSRSKISLIALWTGVILAWVVCAVVLALFNSATTFSAMSIDGASRALMTCVILFVATAILICGLVSTRVYNGNHLYVTNKRVVQQSMISLFNASTNIIDLGSIEDVSFKQTGVIDHVFNIGTLRMSTVGDETTYTFKTIDAPGATLQTLTHLVHEAKAPKKPKKSPETNNETEPAKEE